LEKAKGCLKAFYGERVPPQGGGMVENMKDNIILIGLPGSGKTTLGRQAAEALNMQFYDTDTIVTDRINEEGVFGFLRFSAMFKEYEQDVLLELSKKAKNSIISTSGGVVAFEDCLRILRGMGKLVYINRNPDIIIENDTSTLVWEEVGKPGRKSNTELNVKSHMDLPYEEIADFSFVNDGDENTGLTKLLEIIDHSA
jgi:shikimate kinase